MGIRADHIFKSFGEPPTQVLKDINLTIDDGDFVALTGKSGSGKSTLLYILSSLDPTTSGEVEISGEKISQMSSESLHRFRNRHMGFVFQFHYLLPELTAVENVLMPTVKANMESVKRAHAIHLLEQFDLKEKLHRFPSQLSGGEQQRVAIARALVMEPDYLFADEPTGNLDSINGEIVMNILKKLNQENKTTIIYVTHDPDFAKLASRQIVLSDGKTI